MQSEYKVSEKEFATQVEDLLKVFGWHWTHFRPGWSKKGYRTPIKGHKGFPDYVAVRNGTCLFIEIKSEEGKLTPEQEDWQNLLQRVARCSLGIQYWLWKPSDAERMVEILR